MTAGAPESVPLYCDTRDLTPFRRAAVRTPVRALADNVGHLAAGVLAGRARGTLAVEGPVPKPGRMPGKASKAVHDAIFGSAEPDRLIALARSFPGWAGLCYIVAGLLFHSQGAHLRASELLRRGLLASNDEDARRYSAACLSRVLVRVEVAERIEVPVLFSEEAVFLALSHSLRETGRTEAALAALAGLPPSLPHALARSVLAAALGRDGEVAAGTEGLCNGDDLSAALLLVRARSLRRLGDFPGARSALQEVLRRRKTDFSLRNDALTERTLLLLDSGRRSLDPRSWQHRKSAGPQMAKAVRRDAEMHELWDREFGRADDS